MIGFKSLTSSLTSKLILWATFKINKFVCVLLLILFYVNLYIYILILVKNKGTQRFYIVKWNYKFTIYSNFNALDFYCTIRQSLFYWHIL